VPILVVHREAASGYGGAVLGGDRASMRRDPGMQQDVVWISDVWYIIYI
jgi:hypothetical protein